MTQEPLPSSHDPHTSPWTRPSQGAPECSLHTPSTTPAAYLSVQSGQERIQLDLQRAAAHAHCRLEDLAQALLGRGAISPA